MRAVLPQRGVWFADVDIDLLSPPGADPLNLTLPSGKVVITLSSDDPTTPPTTLVGTTDPFASGRFHGTGRVRVVGGGNGWNNVLPQLQFQQTPLPSTILYQVTAAAAGEVVADPTPVTFPTGYVRIAGAAARVFGDRDWYVDPVTGITNVTSWPTPVPPSDMQILSFNGNRLEIEVASSYLLTPGLLLTDTQVPPRWDGTLTVVDVEQHFSPTTGNRATLSCSTGSVSRFLSVLTNIVRELSRRDLGRVYQYRVVGQAGALVTVQAVDATLGVPDLLNIPVWQAAGVTTMYTPGQKVLVAFGGGQPGNPTIIVADPTLPLQTTVDAVTQLVLGQVAAITNIGKAPLPLAAGIGTTAAVAAIATWIAAFQAEALLVSPALGAAMVAPSAAVAAALALAATTIPTKTVLAGP